MKVAIAGFGVEGKASYTYWRERGDDVTIVDERDLSPYDLPYGATSITGKHAFRSLADFDLVIRTPSLTPSSLKKAKVWSATNEFFAQCPAPIIGITGTKGKGTTASLTAAILRAAGLTVHLVGNIGVPALAELPKIKKDHVVVYELSSFQLWDVTASPQVAVVLMIEPDHLDVHKNLEDYLAAKANICRFQQAADTCLYHPTNTLSARIAQEGQAAAARYAIADDDQAYIKENTFFVQQIAICGIDAVQLPGHHNLENACAAISAAYRFTQDAIAIETGLRSFTGLPHRLKLVRELDGVSYYDDSIATTPGSAIAAIQSFSQPKILILGGKDKGADYTRLVVMCRDTDTHVLAIGSNGSAIAKLCRKEHVAVTELGSVSMNEIAAAARREAVEGSVVILSPAAASFDMFTSYSDRGDQFVAAVESL
jgi:UDP-N-acetylmuramoylalanine--D-glutamate ligase